MGEEAAMRWKVAGVSVNQIKSKFGGVWPGNQPSLFTGVYQEGGSPAQLIFEGGFVLGKRSLVYSPCWSLWQGAGGWQVDRLTLSWQSTILRSSWGGFARLEEPGGLEE